MILADQAIPFIAESIPPRIGARFLPANGISRETLHDAEILLIRTRTRCNANLLEGSAVKLIATATIGTDHIDLGYCRDHGITVVNAPGCNAWGVVQWVIAALHHLALRLNLPIESLRVGIVGRGEVGARLAHMLDLLSIPHLDCDPPRADRGEANLAPLEHLLSECNVISLHTPLIQQGPYPTLGLINAKLLSACQPGTILLNAARGEIIDAKALLNAQTKGQIAAFALDVYPGEPLIDPDLLDRAVISTPHIAGYTLEGKWNASRAVLMAAGHHLGDSWDLPTLGELNFPPASLPMPLTLQTIAATYPIEQDSRRLKMAPSEFENLRNRYAYRRDGGLSQLHNPNLQNRQTPYAIVTP